MRRGSSVVSRRRHGHMDHPLMEPIVGTAFGRPCFWKHRSITAWRDEAGPMPDAALSAIKHSASLWRVIHPPDASRYSVWNVSDASMRKSRGIPAAGISRSQLTRKEQFGRHCDNSQKPLKTPEPSRAELNPDPARPEVGRRLITTAPATHVYGDCGST